MSKRHRARPLPNGQQQCSAFNCFFTGTSEEITAHVQFRVTKSPDGSWSGPANTTAASLGDLLSQLVPSRA